MITALARINWDNLGELVIAVIIICGIFAIGAIVINTLEWKIPGWVIKVFYVLALCVVAVLAIRFLLSLQ